MPRLTVLAVALVALLAAAVPSAHAAKAAGPTIKSFSPTKPELGGKLTLFGKGFAKQRKRNTVILRAPSGATTFLKPLKASRTKLVVRLRASISRLMRKKAGASVATRFRIRVLAGKRFGPWTKLRRSPVIRPGDAKDDGGAVGDCDADGVPNGDDNDDDNDLLSDTLEEQIKTDACDEDTDGDAITDGYEEQSAIDLNHYPRTPPLPYPGKRPYPNALDPTDDGTDYDDDGLSLREEFLLWTNYASDGVKRGGAPTTLDGLLYSDGLQMSIDPPPFAPSAPLDNWSLTIDDDAVLGDDERDGDGDGLNNWDEQSGRFTEGWWVAQHDGKNEPLESRYPELNFLDNENLPNKDALITSDMDGDGVDDGDDDHDHDGLSNQFEVERPDNWLFQAWGGHLDVDGNPSPDDDGVWQEGTNSWAYTQPFNPCKPFRSERCHQHPPFGYYTADQVPPIGPNPPDGYPDNHPTTPNG